MVNNHNMTLASILLILMTMVSPVTQQKQLHQQQKSFNIILPTWSIIILQSIIYSHWILLLSSLCIYKTLIKYQVVLKCYNYNNNNIQNILLDYHQFQFNSNEEKGVDAIIDNSKEISSPTTTTQKSQINPKEMSTHASPISFKKKVNHNKQKHQQQQQQKKQQYQKEKLLALERAKSQEWIVVTETKKNKKRASSHPTTVTPPSSSRPVKQEKRRSSSTTTSAAVSPSNNNNNNNKSKSKCDKNQKVNNSSSPMINNKVHNNNNALVPPKLPWSNIVKSRENEPEVLNNHDDVPFLSDNESSTGSIESPCMSHKDLFHQPTTEGGKYYSPFFSTGIDFGVLPPPQQPQHQQKLTQELMTHSNIDNRLDEYLNSQQPYWNITNKQNYTPSPQQHKNSILNLLNQSDQFETTITPTAFKYFDDMMMSTSLYKTTNDNNVNKFSSLMNDNKRDWNSISHYIR